MIIRTEITIRVLTVLLRPNRVECTSRLCFMLIDDSIINLNVRRIDIIDFVLNSFLTATLRLLIIA